MAQQIKKYRHKNGLTQEQLGASIGVSKQAISKWECGGLPDAETLPLLADALHISVDTLFGREEIDMSSLIAWELCRASEGQCTQLVLSMCYAIAIGLLRNESITENFLNIMNDDEIMTGYGNDYYIKLMKDDYIVNCRITSELTQFFLMSEPKNGLKAFFPKKRSFARCLVYLPTKSFFRLYVICIHAAIPLSLLHLSAR